MYLSKISPLITVLALLALSFSPAPAGAITITQNTDAWVFADKEGKPLIAAGSTPMRRNALIPEDTSDPLRDTTFFMEMRTLLSAVDVAPDAVPAPRALTREPGSIPEPSTLLLLGAGLLSFWFFRRKVRE